MMVNNYININNPISGLQQAQTYGVGVKPVNRITTLLLSIIGVLPAIHI
jgi:hypothetical protein